MQGKATPEKSGVSIIQKNQVQSGYSVGPIPPACATPRIALEKRGDQRMRRVLRTLEFIKQAFKHAVLLAGMQIARVDEEEIQFGLVIADDHRDAGRRYAARLRMGEGVGQVPGADTRLA